tara:strand:- start:323 stop:1954 length:1632 start_codon:yes stop_codon:yes gene_type:complete
MTQTSLFSKRDLATFVPDSIALGANSGLKPNELAAAKFEARLDPSKRVKRYRPGAKPEWLEAQEREEAVAAAVAAAAGRGRRGHPSASTSSFSSGFDNAAPMAAAARSRSRPSASSAGRRRARAAAVVVEEEEESSSDDDSDGGDAVAARRARIRAQVVSDSDSEGGGGGSCEVGAAARRRRGRAAARNDSSEEDAMAIGQAVEGEGGRVGGGGGGGAIDDDKEEGGESSGSWETDTSDDSDEEAGAAAGAAGGAVANRWKRRMVKPTFVAKAQRVTLQEVEARAAQAAATAAEHATRMEAREEESRQLVVEEIRKDYEEGDGEMVTDFNKPDDRDLTDDEEEFEEWKLREMRRLARELEEKEARLHEESELLRRRSMTQAERDAEDVRLIAAGLRKDAAAPREKRGFMQRYYHKGVFYMDEKSMDDGAAAKMRRDFAEPVAKDDVRRRSYNEATGEDRVNKSALPEVMQVRKFGLKGRTKYTHLRDQDTSQQEKSLWSDAQRDQRMRSKYESRMGGVHGGVDGAAAMARRASQKRPREAAEK